MPSPPAPPARSRPDPPQVPPLSPAVKADRDKKAAFFKDRERLERNSVLRGLILLALVAAAFSIFHAGLPRAFYTGWWRQW